MCQCSVCVCIYLLFVCVGGCFLRTVVSTTVSAKNNCSFAFQLSPFELHSSEARTRSTINTPHTSHRSARHPQQRRRIATTRAHLSYSDRPRRFCLRSTSTVGPDYIGVRQSAIPARAGARSRAISRSSFFMHAPRSFDGCAWM